MKNSFGITTLVSTMQWLDNYIQQNGRAYINTTSRLYYQPDSSLYGYVAYAAPFKSFVYDSGVTGANILTTVSGDFGSLSVGQSGMIVDYNNGRVLFPTSFGTGKLVSGSYAFKEINVYKANDTQEKIVFTNKYYLNSRFSRPITGLPPPNAFVTPAIFVTTEQTENEQWALGGLYNTKINVALTILAETNTQLENCLSLLADAKDAYLPQLNSNVWPLNELGGLKSGYNYNDIKTQYGDPSNLYAITDIQTSKVSDSTKIDESIYVGLADLTIEKIRRIR